MAGCGSTPCLPSICLTANVSRNTHHQAEYDLPVGRWRPRCCSTVTLPMDSSAKIFDLESETSETCLSTGQAFRCWEALGVETFRLSFVELNASDDSSLRLFH